MIIQIWKGDFINTDSLVRFGFDTIGVNDGCTVAFVYEMTTGEQRDVAVAEMADFPAAEKLIEKVSEQLYTVAATGKVFDMYRCIGFILGEMGYKEAEKTSAK